MLEFGSLESDMAYGCVLHAKSGNEYVSFAISSLILTTNLDGGNPVHHIANVKLCEDKRTVIEPACQRAHDEHPADRAITLEERHFSPAVPGAAR
jgi:hypothetical protein